MVPTLRASGLVHGDLGQSMWTDRPVSTEISLRFGLSVELAVLALLVSVCVALSLGALSASGRNTPLDYAVRIFSVGGLGERIVVARHAARNAVLPVVTLAGLEFATLLGGLVITEQVFNLNGLGKLLIDAISHRDYTMTQALVMLTAVLFLATNLVVDVGYAWLDPRVRLAR
jgi:ABC-type dipeptide/oligopeptide/nickel transport system permease component